MASRATRYLAPVLRSGFRSSKTAFRTSGSRGMATTTSQSTKSSDLPWIIGSGLVFVPTVAWILSSGKGKKDAHPTIKAPKEHVAVEETEKESTLEPPTAEPTPEPVPEEKPTESEATPEADATESGVSDDDGVVISKEDLEESINKAVDADSPKDAKAVETAEPTSSEPAPAPSESEPVKDSQAAAPPKESTESTPPSSSSTEKEQPTSK